MSFASARFPRLALAAGLALLVTACGGGGDTADESANQALDSNIMFEEPANDASALEAVANASEPVAVTEEETNTSETETNVTGETDGGDTGGNTNDGEDVVGM